MAEDLLVTEQLEDGYEFVRRLARADAGVSVAFWAKRDADASWTIWLGYGTKPTDGGFRLLLGAADGLPEIRLGFSRRVTLDDPAAALAVQLRDRRPQQNRPVHVGPKLLRPVGLYEAVIYPKIGKMNPGEVAVALAHEMNRAGESSPVTLTLADGAEVRGYPLAIRKSAVGGAMVELADADTKGKGADVPLDRIFSVVPDSLTP